MYLAVIHLVLPAFRGQFEDLQLELPAFTTLALLPATWPLASTALILALAAVAARFRGRWASPLLALQFGAVLLLLVVALFLPRLELL